MSTRLPPIYVLAFGAIYGSTIGFAKLAANGGISPIALVFWQMLGAGLLLLALAVIRGEAPGLSMRHLRYYLVAGAVGNAIPLTLTFTAATEIGAALTGLVYPLSPLFTFAMAVPLGIEAKNRLKLVGLLVGMAGAALIVVPQALNPSGGDAPPVGWLLMALTIPLFLAAGNIYRSADWPPNAKSLSLAAGMLLATALLMGPTMLISGEIYLPFSGGGPDWTIGVNLLLSFFGYIVYFELQRIAGPVYFAQVSYSITLTAMTFGLVVFQERPTGWVFVACLLIFGGLALVTQAQKRLTRASDG